MQTQLKTDAVGNKLRGKRVVLASASARRKEILEECLGWTGFEVIPSTFEETLSHADYVGRELAYPVETAAQKVNTAQLGFFFSLERGEASIETRARLWLLSMVE